MENFDPPSTLIGASTPNLHQNLIDNSIDESVNIKKAQDVFLEINQLTNQLSQLKDPLNEGALNIFRDIENRLANIFNIITFWIEKYEGRFSTDMYVIRIAYTKAILSFQRQRDFIKFTVPALADVLAQFEDSLRVEQSQAVPDYVSNIISILSNNKNGSTPTIDSLSTAPTSNFNDIFGYDDVKRSIMVDTHILSTVISSSYHAILFYGPPGTGKTVLANSIANYLNAKFIPLSQATLVKGVFGESERILSSLIAESQQTTQPVVIFFDEIDNLFTRADNASELAKALTTQFLTSVNKDLKSNLYIIGATNYLSRIDEGVTSRMKSKIYVPLPNSEIKINTFTKIVKIPDLFDEFINENTNRYSIRDIVSLAEQIQRWQLEIIIFNNVYKYENVGAYNLKGQFISNSLIVQPNVINGIFEKFNIQNISDNLVELIDDDKTKYIDLIAAPIPSYDVLKQIQKNIKPISIALLSTYNET